MVNTQIVKEFWKNIQEKDYKVLADKFEEGAIIDWNNQNERFNVVNFVRANKEFPGKWRLTVEKMYEIKNTVIAITLCEIVDEALEVQHSFYATSFFEFQNGKITYLSEYYSDNTPPPKWREELKLSTPIK